MPPLPVADPERMRQPRQPLAQQRVDPRRRQGVRQPLDRLRVVAAQDAVVERLECDAPLRQLPLRYSCPLMHRLALYGKYEQNFRKNGPKSSSTA